MFRKKHIERILWFIPLATILVIYWSTIGGEFISLDDYKQIVNNPLIRNFSLIGLQDIFSETILGAYIPITLLSWSADYFLHELDPKVFHATNVILHCLNALLLYHVVKSITQHSYVAFAISMVFATHPMNVEVVVWASARKDLLYAFFILLGFISYNKYITQKEGKWLVLALFAFVLSVLSKAVAVAFPIWLILADLLIYNKRDVKAILSEKLPMILVAILLGLVAIRANFDNPAVVDNSENPWYFGLVSVLNTYAEITQKFFVPQNLSAYHPRITLEGLTTLKIIQLTAIPLVLMSLSYFIRKNRLALFGLLFFFIGLLPVSQIIPFGVSAYGERFGYLPLIGLSVAVASLIHSSSITSNTMFKRVATLSFLGVLLFFGVRSYSYAKVWKDNMTFWNHIVRSYPDDSFPYYNRGLHLAGQGDSKAAIRDFSKSISFSATPWALNNRGMEYMVQGNHGISKSDFLYAIIIDSTYGLSYMNLGVVNIAEMNYEEALRNLLKAEELGMNKDFRVYYNLAIVHEALGQRSQAIRVLDLAIRINPKFSPAYYKRARLNALGSNFEPALEDIRQGLELDPNNVDFIVLRSEIRFARQEYPTALEDAYSAVKMGYPVDKNYLDKLKQEVNDKSVKESNEE